MLAALLQNAGITAGHGAGQKAPDPSLAMAIWHQLHQGLVSDALAVAVLTFVTRVVWHGVGAGGRALRFYLSPAVAQFPAELGPVPVDDDTRRALIGARVYCQLVRFGADDYLQHLASEQERYEGRLQNRVLPVDVVATPEGYRASFLLPVHRRLGTQFKLFLVAASSSHAKLLEESELFRDPERAARRRGRRISFLVKGMQTIANVEKATANNIVYPTNLHDFVATNSFSPLYLRVQRWRLAYARRKHQPATEHPGAPAAIGQGEEPAD